MKSLWNQNRFEEKISGLEFSNFMFKFVNA